MLTLHSLGGSEICDIGDFIGVLTNFGEDQNPRVSDWLITVYVLRKDALLEDSTHRGGV